jgi:hypothetical protein
MFQFSTALRNGALDSIETGIGVSPVLTFRTGLPPANGDLAATGTVIATMTLPADWAAAAAAGAKVLAGTWQDPAADASGRISHFRITGTGQVIQGLVSDPWQASRAYAVGDQVSNGGNLYRATAAGTSAGSGGPSGTGASITDGGVTWAFVQVGSDISLNNATVNAGQLVNITAFTITAGGA